MKVHRYFGPGREERIYENAGAIELQKAGVPAVFQQQIETYYYDDLVGHSIADCIVDAELILEFKAVAAIIPAHETQLVNYLHATKRDVGLLVNFGAPSLEFRTKDREYRKKAQQPGMLFG